MARIPGDHPVTPSGVRAMVVEDEVTLAGVLGSYLEREGFEVHLSHDGQAAMAAGACSETPIRTAGWVTARSATTGSRSRWMAVAKPATMSRVPL